MHEGTYRQHIHNSPLQFINVPVLTLVIVVNITKYKCKEKFTTRLPFLCLALLIANLLIS